MDPNWRMERKQELNKKILRLSTKLTFVMDEARKFGPKMKRKGIRTFGMPRNGIIRHWHKMAKQSIMSIRKQIARIKAEMQYL